MKLSRRANSVPTPKADTKLIQIVDAALAEAARKSGDWPRAGPGCDAMLRGRVRDQSTGRGAFTARDVGSGEERSRKSGGDPAARTGIDKPPGKRFSRQVKTGILDDSDDAQARFEYFGNDEVCPVLDPATGLCELYDARPMTCRVFGPPVRSGSDGENGLGVCELCYHGATDEQIEACEMKPDPTIWKRNSCGARKKHLG